MMWDIQLDRSDGTSLQRQLYRTLKDRIQSGRIAAGETLPSTRELAGELGVSRNTVSAAYDMLWTEGYIVSRQGAPSRVAEGLRLQRCDTQKPGIHAARQETAIRWDFSTGKPDLAAFPWKQWNEALKFAADSLNAQQYAYT
ncbi:MAG: GntR family transcriptional regulator, partial [Firmicutes bacterium]|nr:GntR family transcriptional regulator [Bacillota bacterium]